MELIDKFLKFEYTERLFEKEIQGVKFWHYIRFSMYMEISRQKHNIGQTHLNLSDKKFITRVWYKLKQIPDFVLKNPLYGLNQRDILVLNHSRRIKNGEYYNCIHTDEILENIDNSYYVFEEPYLEKHFRPIKTKNIRYFDYINFIISIKIKTFKFINPNYGKLCNNDINQLFSLLNAINKAFNVDIDKHKAIKNIENLILNYKISKKYYERILYKVNPRIIVEVCSYGFSKLLINELAKKRRIKIIELQHGIMGKNHIAYNFYKKYKLEKFPDYIFLFGDFWRKNIHFPINKEHLIVTGFPYRENRINELRCRNRNSKKQKENILFISHSSIGKQLSKIAIELNKLIDHKKYSIIYKLHSEEYDKWKTSYSWLGRSSIKIVDNNKKDIYYYLNKTSYLIGCNSTVIFEAIGFNLKIFIYEIFESKNMKELYENNYIQFVTSAEEIVNELEYNKKNNNRTSKIFWQNNSMNNIIKNINSIMKRK